jgi:hypothetical protein
VATSGTGEPVIEIVVGVGLISGVGSVSGGSPDGSCRGGRIGVAVGTGRYGSPPLSGVITGLGATFPGAPTFSTVGSSVSNTADKAVGVGGLDSSGSSLPHAEIASANNAAKISTVFGRRFPIIDSMKSLSTSHNGCFPAFATTTSVTNPNNQ